MLGDVKSWIIISDTHGLPFPPTSPIFDLKADIPIHCGDLTQHSKISEFRTTLSILPGFKKIPVKLILAENHDFPLDPTALQSKLYESYRLNPNLLDEQDLVEREHGKEREALYLLQSAAEDGILFLQERNHNSTLNNGAELKVYASTHISSAIAKGEVNHFCNLIMGSF